MFACSPNNPSCFTAFKSDISNIELPQAFTFPFYYEPHKLCEIAALELQQHLCEQTSWEYNFGVNSQGELSNIELSNAISSSTSPNHVSDLLAPSGKMFGVLVVKDKNNNMGYLSAFSGKLANQTQLPSFVPPVCDDFAQDELFINEQKNINAINAQIVSLSANPKIKKFRNTLAEHDRSAKKDIQTHKALMKTAKNSRNIQRSEAEKKLSINTLSKVDYQDLKKALSQESIAHKIQLRDLILHWKEKCETIEHPLLELTNEIDNLKVLRKKLSTKLQQKLFSQYTFLNIKGESKNLVDIFSVLPEHIPPAGSGDCAAPKLLQYAFSHQLQPIAMAEFWWGVAPKSAIRQHKNTYPSCNSKCQPILGHMLSGMKVDKNPLLENPAQDKHLDIIYQDNDMVIVNKPAEFLSVPGKNITDSVYQRIKNAFPAATGTLVVHRLDMSTSGLMVLALTKRAQKNLQKQFINRSIKKRYVAVINKCTKKEANGVIELPLRGDLHDRPRQLVCFEHGKPARTYFEIIEQSNNKTKLYLYPETGRTHQLRMHCAHPLGFNSPIIGDDLYGKKANRLHLHAERLCLEHPITRKYMEFQVDADF